MNRPLFRRIGAFSVHSLPFRAAILSGLILVPLLSAQLVFEAETLVVNRDAMLKDKFTDGAWNLWSTDKDAMKKWSGGIVIQSPRVMENRTAPEEGAPPLHLRITDVPKGTYNVELGRVGRVLGVSLDGTTWRRFMGGVLASSVDIADGTFEFWVDDMYAVEEEAKRGSGYLDTVALYRLTTVRDGVANPGFEETDDNGNLLGWGWWSREGVGSATVSEESPHAGKRCAHIVHDAERDWAFSCGTRMTVTPEQELAVHGWIRGSAGEGPIGIDVVGLHDGQTVTWRVGSARFSPAAQWQEAKGFLVVPDDVTELYVRVTGSGKTDIYVDDVSLREEKIVFPEKPKVDGFAEKRVDEALDRGVIAFRTGAGVYVGWRLLREDPAGIAFDLFRSIDAAEPTKVNDAPIRQTTDFLDFDAPAAGEMTYSVRPAAGLQGRSGAAAVRDVVGDTAFLAFQLKDPEETFQKAGVADLNGDGAYDFVIKQPSANIDPADSYWYKSPETYKIEAYLNDGTRLWDKDLGWAIERGIWYSPYIVYDLNGDGRAEVAAKIGEGDPRDEDGRVRAGPEWVVVWDGMTGDELARAPWPTRDGIRNYNLQSRNQIAVAYLDGKTPCLLTLRGTYGRMKVDAYHMPDGNLVKLWSYDNENYGSRFWGQGAHFTLCADIDGDSRDEVILGSAVLDDNGVPLWTTGRGHPDAHYLSDIDPDNPGLELAYVMESRQRKGGGLNVVDAAGGRLLWKLDTPTRHVHGKGICADLDPTVPGLEVYGADADGHKLTESRWLFSGSGDLLRSGSDCTYSFGVRTVYWDADLQKELARGKISDHDGNPVGGRTEGGIVLIADVIGDWREELITSVKGELRVYTTTIPAMDRRVCLMQDPNYRLSTAMNAMGYTQNSTVLYNPEMRSPNLNLTLMERGQESPVCRIVVSAPAEKGLSGDVQIVAPEGVEATPAAFSVNLSPGERIVRTVDLSSAGENRLAGILRARLATAAGVLAGQVPVKLAGGFIKRGIIFQAEAFAEQTGGAVHIRDDKAGTMGKSISHWDDKGHTLTWRFDVPEAGTYRLVARYCTPKTVTRNAEIDGRKLAPQTLPSTGGFGDMAADWEHTPFTADGRALRLQLKPGQHTVRLENTDGNGCNLDYLALVPAN